MPVELCHHVKEDGISCHSPAVRGEGYCYFHLRYKGRALRTWRNRHRLCGWHLNQGTQGSLAAIEANLKRVERALASGCPDPARARLIRWGLQQMRTNARYIEAEQAKKAAKKGNARQSGKVQPQTVTPVSPGNSIFCNNTFDVNNLKRNQRQLIDSKDQKKKRLHLASRSRGATKG